MKSSTERDFLMADIASMYYEEEKTQAEIAKRLGCSRSLVSMLLSEALDSGIVNISINYPLPRKTEVERKLCERFSLQDALVIDRKSFGYAKILNLIGRLGAAYLIQNLPDNGILGIGWGTAIYEVVNAMPQQSFPNMKVVQLTGSVSGFGEAHIDGPELARALAMKLGASYHTLNAPAIVSDCKVRDALMKEKQICDVLDLASQAEVVVIGVGTTSPEFSSMVRTGYSSVEELQKIQALGAVGDICGYLFNEAGEILAIEFNCRVVGIDIHNLTRPSCKVIGVAGGIQKSRAILAALRGGFLKVLVTDTLAAEWVLAN